MNSVQVASTQLPTPHIRPRTVVLRPSGCLDGSANLAFRKSLEQALELATDTVVVDMLSVSAVKAEGIKTLMAGMKRAAVLGKNLSLEFLDVATHTVLKDWHYQQV